MIELGGYCLCCFVIVLLVDLFDQCMVQFVDVGMLRLNFELYKVLSLIIGMGSISLRSMLVGFM